MHVETDEGSDRPSEIERHLLNGLERSRDHAPAVSIALDAVTLCLSFGFALAMFSDILWHLCVGDFRAVESAPLPAGSDAGWSHLTLLGWLACVGLSSIRALWRLPSPFSAKLASGDKSRERT